MVGARVNGRMVPYDTHLKNGDIVEVLTSKAAKGPSRDWLKIAKSNEARNKIRQWFKRERREENVATGRALFESELKHAKIPLSSITAEDVLPSILRKVRFGTLDELYASIGYGGTTAVKSVARIKDELLRLGRLKAAKGCGLLPHDGREHHSFPAPPPRWTSASSRAPTSTPIRASSWRAWATAW